MKCQLTGKEGKFIKAHIIPKSFFNIKKNNADNLLIDGRVNRYPKRAPIGVYDKKILTEEGEKYFQEIDDYGSKVLLNKRSEFRDFSPAKGKTGKALDKNYFDYKKLKIFFLSILWRASVSDQVGYEKVSLGKKYEKNIKEIILNYDLKNDIFDILLFRFDHPAFNKGTIILPIRSKMNGLNFYKIYLAEYIIYIKIDNRPIDNILRQITLKEGRDLLIYDKDYSSSNERKILEKMMDEKKSIMPDWFIKKSDL